MAAAAVARQQARRQKPQARRQKPQAKSQKPKTIAVSGSWLSALQTTRRRRIVASVSREIRQAGRISVPQSGDLAMWAGGRARTATGYQSDRTCAYSRISRSLVMTNASRVRAVATMI